MVVTDQGKEFCTEEFLRMCSSYGVRHNKVGVEAFMGNRRVERVIGTLKERLIKMKEGTL